MPEELRTSKEATLVDDGSGSVTPERCQTPHCAHWVLNGALAESDPANAIIATVPVVGRPFLVAVNPTTNRVYVGKGRLSLVSAIAGATNTVIATVRPGGGTRLDVDATTSRVYTTDAPFNTVTVIADTLELRGPA